MVNGLTVWNEIKFYTTAGVIAPAVVILISSHHALFQDND